MKTKVIITLLVITTLLCACTAGSNEKYTIFYENGKCYMEFPKDTAATKETDSALSGNIAIEYPSFDSVAEMKEAILGGNVSDRELYALRVQSTDDVLEICDPNKLCDLTLPDSVSIRSVTWRGDHYSFGIKGNLARGYVMCVDEESYNQNFSYHYLNYPDSKFHSVNSDTTTSERNARLVDSDTSQVNFKTLLYELPTTSGNTLYVQEQFLLRWFNDPTGETSETIPDQIRFFGNWNGNYFYGWLHEFEERPSVEWLSSFGLVSLDTNTSS